VNEEVDRVDKAIDGINLIGQKAVPELFKMLNDYIQPEHRDEYIAQLYLWTKNISAMLCKTFAVTEEEAQKKAQEFATKRAIEERLEELHFMRYQEYLQTPEWRERRKRILERDGYKCQVCNSPDRLNVHHRDYTRRGYENDADLTTLCQGCHQVFHENGRLVKVTE